MSNEHIIYTATARQIAGLELEREAHLQQIRALVDERDALRETASAWRGAHDILLAKLVKAESEIDELRTANTDPFDLATLDTEADHAS